MFSYFKNRKTTYFDVFCLNFSIETKIKTFFLISYFNLSKKRNGTLGTRLICIFDEVGFIFSVSLWKEFQLLQLLNDLSIKHLIKLTLYENDVKLLNLREVQYMSICDMFEVWDLDFWYLKWMHQEKRWNG